MSSYVSFWVKNKKGQYAPLFSFSRNNSIYQACYETGLDCKFIKKDDNDYFGSRYAIPFTREMSNEACDWLKDEINKCTQRITEYKDLIKQIWQTNNSLDEKTEYVTSYNQIIEEYKEDLEQNQWGLNMITAIEWIREANGYDNAAEVIYAGIDCCLEGEEDE